MWLQIIKVVDGRTVGRTDRQHTIAISRIMR